MRSSRLVFKSYATTLSLLLVGSLALASEDVIPLKQGGPAPFDGMLYPPELAINLARKAERCEHALAEEKGYGDRRVDFEQQYCGRKVDIEKQLSDYRFDAVEDRPSSRWELIGAYVLGAVTVAFAVWATTEARQ